jgi:hypothetical protein
MQGTTPMPTSPSLYKPIAALAPAWFIPLPGSGLITVRAFGGDTTTGDTTTWVTGEVSTGHWPTDNLEARFAFTPETAARFGAALLAAANAAGWVDPNDAPPGGVPAEASDG